MTDKNPAVRHILCINAGSSSVKSALYRVPPPDEPHRLASIEASGIAEDVGRLRWQVDGRRHATRALRLESHQAAIGAILEKLRGQRLPEPDALGHRIVRSPRGRSAPAWLASDLRKALEDLRELAPLHIPHELEAIDAATDQFGGVPQILCFDNHFFSSLPLVARRLPIPRALDDAGIERIGYHGLSYEYVVHKLGPLRGRTVVAHLGNGASMAALRDGAPVDTTMSYTPTGGLMMGSRSGDLDPGVVIALMRREKLGAGELEHLLNYRSGLLGVSGGESSMQDLLDRPFHDEPANQAVDLFCYIARKHLGAMIAALGGIDTLVFTGGIGEHAAPVRERILAGLDDLGLVLDRAANAAGMPEIGGRHSHARIRVIPTDEDWVIATHTAALLDGKEDATA